MLSTTGRLLRQLNSFYWVQRTETKRIEGSRLVESIEPLFVSRFFLEEESSGTSILLFEDVSFSALRRLSSEGREKFLQQIIHDQIPLVIISQALDEDEAILKQIEQLCLEHKVAVVQTSLKPFQIILDLQAIRDKLQVQSIEIHGTMVDVFGLGILLTGGSGVGKSETALGLIERRHRLVGDDLVRLERHLESLVGSAAQMTRHHMEIRGIGILNIAHMFGIVSVAESKQLDMVVELETWSADQDYDRLGLEWGYEEFLGLRVPHHKLPVKPGRDLVLLIETMVRNHRLRQMGFNSAKEIQQRLQDEIDRNTKAHGQLFLGETS